MNRCALLQFVNGSLDNYLHSRSSPGSKFVYAKFQQVYFNCSRRSLTDYELNNDVFCIIITKTNVIAAVNSFKATSWVIYAW